MSPTPAPKPARHLRASDARAVAHLATQATAGVTRIVEGAHLSILKTLGNPGSTTPGQTAGITGLVYRSIQEATRVIGKGVDTLLAGLLPEPADATAQSTPEREAVLAALNGVMGDSLVASGNPFATPMSLRWRGQVLNGRDPAHLTPPLAPPAASGKLLLLIHGLCMNDLQWQAQHQGQPVDHGAALAALGYTPLYLRYNSGRHVSQNGRELALMLEPLLADWPLPLTELTVVAHSMGGLLIRSAVQVAREAGLRWPATLKNIVFLGTPHHGAPLERAGNWVDVLLGATPWSAPYAKLGQLRGAGITDLRYGHLLDADWQGHDRFRRQPDRRTPLPLPEGVACYAYAATTAARRGALADRLVGDGLVPLHSALGVHDDTARSLAFPKARQAIAYRMNHMELLSRPEVTQQLLAWLGPQRQPHGANGIEAAA